MASIETFERIPLFQLPKTEPSNITNGINELIKANFGIDAADTLSVNIISLNSLRDKCVEAINNPGISFKELKSAILEYCYQIECLVKLLPEFIDHSQYFIFQWSSLISDEYSYQHDPKFDQMSFLYCLVASLINKLYTVQHNRQELQQTQQDLILCESIVAYFQNFYCKLTPPTVNFYPGVISVLLGLIQLFMEQISIEIMIIEKKHAHSIAKSYGNQFRICDNILSDLETSIPLLQQKYEDYTSMKKKLCEANCYLKMADTFSSSEIIESSSYLEKSLSIINSTCANYRGNLGALKVYFDKCRNDIELKKRQLSSPQVFSSTLANKIAVTMPSGTFLPVCEPFSFSSISNIENLFASIGSLDKDFMEFEQRFKRKLINLFNEKLEEAKNLTEDYHQKITAFNFDELFSIDHEDVPEKLYQEPIDIKALATKINEITKLLNNNIQQIQTLSANQEINQEDSNILENIKKYNLEITSFLKEATSKLEEMQYLDTCQSQNFQNLPSLLDVDFGESKCYINDVKKLLIKGDEMIFQRDKCISELKIIVLNYDCSPKYLFDTKKNSEEHVMTIATDSFREFKEDQTLCINFNAQNFLISILIDKNSKIIVAREAVHSIESKRSKSIGKLLELNQAAVELQSHAHHVASKLTKDQNEMARINGRRSSVYGRSSQFPGRSMLPVIEPNSQFSTYPYPPYKNQIGFDNNIRAEASIQPNISTISSESRILCDPTKEQQINYALENIQKKYEELGQLIAYLNSLLRSNIVPFNRNTSNINHENLMLRNINVPLTPAMPTECPILAKELTPTTASPVQPTLSPYESSKKLNDGHHPEI